MTLSVRCPGCNKILRVKDEMEGKRIRCPSPGCDTTFRADATAEEAPPPRKKPAREDEAIERPPSNKPAARRSVPPDEDEDEAPRKRKRSRDEDEEDRPRIKKKSGSPALLFVLLGGGVLVLCCGAPTAGFFWLMPKANRAEEAFIKGIDDAIAGGHDPIGAGPAKEWKLDHEEDRIGQVNVFATHPDRAFIVGGGRIGGPPDARRPLDIFDLTSGKKRTSLDASQARLTKKNHSDAHVLAVSPDGSTLLVATSNIIAPTYAVLPANGDAPLVVDWSPTYERKSGDFSDTIEAAACSWLDNRRLLVGYKDGAVDTWTFPGAKRAPLIPAIPLGYLAGKAGFGVSHDQRNLALYQGKTCKLFELPAGRPVRVFDALALTEKLDRNEIRASVVLFSPDNKQVTVLLETGELGKTTNRLAVWDVATGRKVMQTTIPPIKGAVFDVTPDRLTWWGNQHVLVHETDWARAGTPLVDASSGSIVCTVKHSGIIFTGSSTDGKLWFLSKRAAGFKDIWVLQAFDFPTSDVKRCTPAPPGAAPVSILELGNTAIVVK